MNRIVKLLEEFKVGDNFVAPDRYYPTYWTITSIDKDGKFVMTNQFKEVKKETENDLLNALDNGDLRRNVL